MATSKAKTKTKQQADDEEDQEDDSDDEDQEDKNTASGREKAFRDMIAKKRGKK